MRYLFQKKFRCFLVVANSEVFCFFVWSNHKVKPLYLSNIEKLYQLSTSHKVPSMQQDHADPWIGLAEGDSIEAVKVLRARKPDAQVAVLNFANPESVSGGSIWRGSRHQEESLCVRTTLYETLDKERATNYPIRNDQLIYTEDVTCFSLVPGKPFDGSKTFKFDVITCAALKNPGLTQPTATQPVRYANAQEEQIMREKIRMILRVAIQHKVDAVVLGAFGCGVFHHPPHLIAEMIRDALLPGPNSDHIRANGISNVIIPILDSTPGPENWSAFQEVFRDVPGACEIDTLDWIKGMFGIP